MGGGGGGTGGGLVISLNRLDVITSTACAQITFCEIEPLTVNRLLKVTEAKGSGGEVVGPLF